MYAKAGADARPEKHGDGLHDIFEDVEHDNENPV
jgi:hypothetical protein